MVILKTLKRNIMSENSVTLHRVLKATPEKVYHAFTDYNAFSWWIPPYGFLCVIQSIAWHQVAGTITLSCTGVPRYRIFLTAQLIIHADVICHSPIIFYKETL
jgi:hypothetical protein